MNRMDQVFAFIDANKDQMISLQELLTAVPALAPENGGDGESAKAEALLDWCKRKGFGNIEIINAPDNRVSSGNRPNIVVTIPGKSDKKAVWVMSHLDVVPPGEQSLWETDPYTVVRKGEKLFGRGVEDNQQGLVSSVFAALAIQQGGIVPEYDVKLLFIADEEVGSEYGIKYLLDKHDLFGKNDVFMVPDGGLPDGTMIEVAEKSVVWLKFTTKGKQCHASMPQLGNNAFYAGSDLVVTLNRLYELFPEVDDIFTPPGSTFVPTKKENNVPNVNTLPGDDVFCLDCRILPSVSVDAVLAEVDKICRSVAEKHSVKIEYEILESVSSSPTPADCGLVHDLRSCIDEIYHVRGEAVGVGGGTVAAHLRNSGYNAVVWARMDDTAHMPNEYCIIDNIIGDAKVMALMMLKE